VTWTKLGAEFNSECALAGLSDAAYRTHSEAIGWLYEVEETSCRIPKRLFQRFAGSEDAEAAVGELTGAGFWKDAGAVWVVVHHAGVVRQSIAAQQDKRGRDAKAHRFSLARHGVHLGLGFGQRMTGIGDKKCGCAGRLQRYQIVGFADEGELIDIKSQKRRDPTSGGWQQMDPAQFLGPVKLLK